MCQSISCRAHIMSIRDSCVLRHKDYCVGVWDEGLLYVAPAHVHNFTMMELHDEWDIRYNEMYTNMYAGDYTWVQTLLMHMMLPFAHKQTFTGFSHRVFCNWASETCQSCHAHTFLTHLHTFMWKWTEGTVINGWRLWLWSLLSTVTDLWGI